MTTLLAVAKSEAKRKADSAGKGGPGQQTTSAKTQELPCLDGWMIMLLDLLVMSIALVSGSQPHLFFGGRHLSSELMSLQLPFVLSAIFIFSFYISHCILRLSGLYICTREDLTISYVVTSLCGITGCALWTYFCHNLIQNHSSSTSAFFTYWKTTVLLLIAVRGILFYFQYAISPKLRLKRSVVIVGSGEQALKLHAELKRSTTFHYSLIGYVDSEPQTRFAPRNSILGGIEDLEQILMHRVVDEVVIALPMKSQYEAIGRTIALCERLGIQSQYSTHHFGTGLTKQRRLTGKGKSRVALETVHRDGRCYVKRVLDIVVSLLALVFFSPLLIAAAIAIKLSSPGPIFFSQERLGLNKRTFRMFKFRSMAVDAEANQHKLEHLNEIVGPTFKIANDPRVTPIGRFLRKSSIDELPQLVNVLLGQMSLVGPRPLPVRDVNRFSESWLMRRFSVKPGLTCIWQATGRSNTDFDRWIELDLEYIDDWSLSLDWHILFKTIPAVLKGRGAS